MTSLLTKHSVRVGEQNLLITFTGQRTDNDYNGNPQYLVQMWTHNTLYYPRLKGYRERKDNAYKLTGYDLNVLIGEFALEVQNQLNGKHL